MPLAVGTAVVIPPPVVPPTDLPPNDVGTMVASYTDPEGTVWDLTNRADDYGWFTRPDIAGWTATAYEFSTDPLPRGGVDVRFIRSQEARIQWPLHCFGRTHLEFVQRARRIRRAILMTVHRQTPGTLRVERPDGTAREIDVYYEDGLKGEAGEDWLFANPVVTFMAPDGYWRDVAPITAGVKYVTGGHNFLGPGYPRVSSSAVLGGQVLTNPGDVAGWPTWTLTGPATSLVAANSTLGKTWTLTYTLTGGQQATITTSPRPILRGPAGVNISGALNWPTAYLWPLAPGDNAVSFTVGGASAGSRVDMTFNPRYDGA